MIKLIKEENATNSENTYGDFTYTFDNRDGYVVTHNPTGREFELLEGISWKGNSTSDIIFIMENTELKNNGFSKFFDFVYGATLSSIEEVLDFIEPKLN